MAFIYILLIFILVVSVFLSIYGSRDNTSYDEDAVIVLGYGVKSGKITAMLKNRLEKVLEYHAKNPDAVIIVSGGRGDENKPSEAEVMKNYLLANGIESDKIIEENKSRTTVENLKFSANLVEKNHTAVVISNTFHIYRSDKYAKASGIDAKHLAAKTEWYDIPWIYIREVAMVVHMFFTKGRNFK